MSNRESAAQGSAVFIDSGRAQQSKKAEITITVAKSINTECGLQTKTV